MSLRQTILAAAARIAAHPELQPDAYRDAELLLLHTLNLPAQRLHLDPNRPPPRPSRRLANRAIRN